MNNITDFLGELFITGISGLTLSDDSSRFLADSHIGGVLLFSQNYDNPAQVGTLIQQIQDNRPSGSPPLWISVDHEGGRVQRFKSKFSLIPTAAAIGATGSPKLAFEIGQLMATELCAVGVNLNFCPIADINTNPQNPVIGDRAYGTTHEEVSKYSSAVVRGHLTAKVQPCVKHFPGHGDTNQDSHFALPSVTTTLDVLQQREFLPFSKAFRSGCNTLMTAHVIMKAIDPDVPATLSSKVLREILRGQLNYRGLIISDDLEMQAITDHYGAKDAPRLALQAGCDLLIYRTEKAARIGYEALLSDLKSGKLDPEIVMTAAERSIELKKKVLEPYQAPDFAKLDTLLGCGAHQAILSKVSS